MIMKSATTLLTILTALPTHPVCAADKFHRLKLAEIRSIVIGKTITDEAHWADKFLDGGILGGHRLGRTQTGSWELSESGEVCVMRKVSTVESDCFEIWLNRNQVQYRNGSILLSEGVLRDE